MSIEAKRVVWVQFAVGAMREAIAQKMADVPTFTELMADKMTEKWDQRFGDAAFMLEGQSECGNCHKPLPDGTSFVASVDGVKFCGVPCLKGSGREE